MSYEDVLFLRLDSYDSWRVSTRNPHLHHHLLAWRVLVPCGAAFRRCSARVTWDCPSPGHRWYLKRKLMIYEWMEWGWMGYLWVSMGIYGYLGIRFSERTLQGPEPIWHPQPQDILGDEANWSSWFHHIAESNRNPNGRGNMYTYIYNIIYIYI